MLTTLALAANLVATAGAAPCESLHSLSLPDTTILSATLVPEGLFTPVPGTGKPLSVPAACRVVGRVTPAITFEVWMPVVNWNGKFQAVGGGGFAGVISYGAMATALRRGYATASTDTGHSTPGGSWALGHPELVTDYAYRAIHEMTVKAKAVIAAFYEKGPRLSYFVGCSTGGRQGLMEAQRFPNDYDGIVAGAPANFFTHLMAGSLWPAAATLKDPAAALTPGKLALLNKAALAACDARDGAADGLIENPAACRFDPGTLVCTGADSESCLTAPQLDAARKIYAPSVNPRTKQEIFPGMAPGSELTWTALAGGPQPFPIPVEFYKYFVHADANWDWKTFDFDKDVAAADEKFAAMINATDPNLSAFKSRGGKLIMYHGWNDQLIQAGNTINYYNSVVKTMAAKETDDFLRLFMAPGMLHCAGGAGPNTFDAVGALEQWVENGIKPASIVASHMTSGVVDRTRPLCPYPQVAVYKGSGSLDDAANFACGTNAQGVQVVDLGGGIYQAVGAGIQGGSGVRVPQSNTFLIATSGGNVIVDTSIAAAARAHKDALSAVKAGPVHAIILTHAHGDHTGGIATWRELNTKVIVHRLYPEFLDYTNRLAGYFAKSNVAQFGGAARPAAVSPALGALTNAAAAASRVMFDDTYTLDVGDTRFELLHTPGETPDHLTVWIPKLKAAFVGDNYYESFPNIYTLRGTRPRWALDYVDSLNKILALDPEMVLPSHGPAIKGRDEVRRRLTRYRDAILYVHDATVKGMNDGTDVTTLMREIKLPPALDVGESYGKLSWSVRGIYEGYVGWFDGNVSTMFGSASQAYGEIVALAGGPDVVAARALALAATDPIRALYLTDMSLARAAGHKPSLVARIAALKTLDTQSTNSNERGWLAAGIRDAEAKLTQ
jgi:feruloyl esterase